MMLYMGRRAREAARELALASTEAKNEALERMAARIELSAEKIVEANRQDLEAAQSKGRDAAFLDRLRLDGLRVAAMARGLREVAALADPVGQVMARWTRPNGLEISRVRVPLGVIGIIYESRPNVTADAAALCLKSGNAVILRSGSESFLTSLVIANALSEAVVAVGSAGSLDPARADGRSLGGGLHAGRTGRRHRRDRAARRQGSRGARAGRSARAGVRASRRRLPRLCGQGRRSRHGEAHRAQRQAAPHRRLRRRPRRCWSIVPPRRRILRRWSKC